jgi:hypothetical protein
MPTFDINNRLELLEFKFPNSNSSQYKPVTVFLDPGVYIFELFGASGGNGYRPHLKITTYGGLGGYARGCVRLFKRTKVYLFIGGKGTTNAEGEPFAYGGFNGGGKGAIGNYEYPVGSGGGATDVRIGCMTPNCRIIVAGGGGAGAPGCSQTDANLGRGGSGGGTSGMDGNGWYTVDDTYRGIGATQNSVGTGGYDLYRRSEDGIGERGGELLNTKLFDSSSGGGGGGYYGGGAGGAGGGGGGSGYLHPSLFEFEGYHNLLKDGSSSTFDLYGNQIRGNAGNGYIRITTIYREYISFTRCTQCIYVRIIPLTLINIFYSVL